ncbi:Serine/threonine-protein kinase stk11 [Clonorchis sinensis]|uniref:non-specific serine/threonine protein kinase n=1 Tax=Clonorchis sinensis TaxID=79923 RepID=A0A8T1LWQ2_CLOSI|nr:Serine/threonine-protein kinase stk11 [Clonorchis sinensis]
MFTELDTTRLPDVVAADEIPDQTESSYLFSSNLPRQNLAGGRGVFANFFEEMAGPGTTDALTNQTQCNSKEPNKSARFEAPFTKEECENDFFALSDHGYPMQAFYDNLADNDLDILDQYKHFVDRSRENSTPIEPYCCAAPSMDQPSWDADPNTPSMRPGGITGYMHGELGSDMCISYVQRCKPPKVLAKRFLLGETIGRGSYGKVKDAVDLVTLRRHAVKVISKLAIRKIPGGWSQVLLEASVMLRLPPHRHIVSLLSVLRLDNPDRLCLVMEHCLGSVHDLQAAGVPSIPGEEDEEFDVGLKFVPGAGKESTGADNSHPRSSIPYQATSDAHHNSESTRRAPKPNRFSRQLPTISTDIKQETKKFADAFRRRKVSNIEHGHRKKSIPQHSQQQQFRRLPEAQAHAYFLQLIDGLDFLHRNGVIHRDIKPANLLLTPAPGCGLGDLHSVAEFMDAADSGWLDGNGGQPGFLGRSLSDLLAASRGWLVKLTDFGVSASLSAFQPTDQVSGGQTTPAVQPPEVAKGVQSVFVGSKLDVYSAGVSLYFMLTGRVPFSCQNVLQIFEAIAQGEYTIPGHVSTHAAHLVRKMMYKDPKKRYTLEQISKHPWVINDPTPALTMEHLRAKFRVTSSHMFLDHGITCWLNPLDYLNRNASEFPAPHIDETGARIFTLVELIGSEPTTPSALNEAGSEDGDLGSQQWVAPISVVDRLRLFNQLSDPSKMAEIDHDQCHRFTRANAPGSDGLESRLAKLGITSERFADAGVSSFLDPSLRLKERHYSGGTEHVHHPFDSSYYRQRGVTISLPARSFRQDVSQTQPLDAESTLCEPPVCPADLPVSPPMQLFGHQAALTLGHGGKMRATSLSGRDEEYAPNNQQTESHFTWHSGSRSAFSPAQISDLSSGRRARTYESNMDAQGVDAKDEPSPIAYSNPVLGRSADSGAHRQPSSRIGRRITQWLASPFSSLRRRLRNRRHKDVRFGDVTFECPDTNDSAFSHSSDQTISTPTDPTGSFKGKRHRWLLQRTKSRNGAAPPMTNTANKRPTR